MDMLLVIGTFTLTIFLCRLARGWFIRRHQVPKRAPAPKLSPRWATPPCRHGDLIEVDEKLTGEVVAYICGRCSEQLPMDDPAAIRLRQDKEILKNWEGVQVAVDEFGNQTRSQAETFALRAQALERLGTPVEMLWDKIPPWKDEDTSFAQEVLKPQIEAIRIGYPSVPWGSEASGWVDIIDSGTGEVVKRVWNPGR